MSEQRESPERKGDESPAEKLEDAPPTGPLKPGTENPESEVQNEKGMNTE